MPSFANSRLPFGAIARASFSIASDEYPQCRAVDGDGMATALLVAGDRHDVGDQRLKRGGTSRPALERR